MSEVTKRTVSTDALETLGTIIDDKQKRDAIHLAVLPVVAGEPLDPGEEIVLSSNGEAMGADMGGLAIVDPFLSKKVRTGERFWMVLKPRLVQSLRHVWSHPAFPDETGAVSAAAVSSETEDKEASPYRLVSSWSVIDRYAGEVGMDRADLMEATREYKERGAWVTLDHSGFDGLNDDFWDAYDVVTGEQTPENERENFFSCSC